jgi:hypothetical protein
VVGYLTFAAGPDPGGLPKGAVWRTPQIPGFHALLYSKTKNHLENGSRKIIIDKKIYGQKDPLKKVAAIRFVKGLLMTRKRRRNAQ